MGPLSPPPVTHYIHFFFFFFAIGRSARAVPATGSATPPPLPFFRRNIGSPPLSPDRAPSLFFPSPLLGTRTALFPFFCEGGDFFARAKILFSLFFCWRHFFFYGAAYLCFVSPLPFSPLFPACADRRSFSTVDYSSP